MISAYFFILLEKQLRLLNNCYCGGKLLSSHGAVTAIMQCFHPVKSPEHKRTGAKEIKALYKHTQQHGWSCHGPGHWTVLTIFCFES